MINTYRNNNHIIKEVCFGFGDIMPHAISEGDARGFAFLECEKGEIGRVFEPLKDIDDVINNKAEVILKFANIESLYVTINNLKILKNQWEKELIYDTDTSKQSDS